MASAIFVNGPCLVKVKYGTGSSRTLSELGLTEAAVRIQINPHWYDAQADDWGTGGAFGGQVPPEVLMLPADATIHMDLIHFDRNVLDTCMVSIGGNGGSLGTLNAPGTPLGGGQAADSDNNTLYKYISLNLTSPNASKPWRFPTAYMMQQPMEFPIGTEKSVVKLVWRAVPYCGASVGSPTAAGMTLWSHTADT